MSRTGLAVLMVLVMAVWVGTVSAQPGKKVAFKKGQIQFKMRGRSFVVPLSTEADAGTFDTSVPVGGIKPASSLALVYESDLDQQVTFVLFNLSGPGKYGQANIYMLHARGGPGVWEGKNCTFVFTRLDASGVDGTVACAAGGGDAPFTDMKFTASPG
jgi:hypothetical protein